jgi:hypothetical protein
MPPDDTGAPIPDDLRDLDPRGAGDTAAPGDGGLPPPRIEVPPPEGALSKEDAARFARLGIDWILAAVCRQYPVLVYPEETRERAAQLAGAVLAKYDVLSWAAKWRAEFELGIFVAALAWESYQRVQAAQRAPAVGGVTDQAPPAAPSPES